MPEIIIPGHGQGDLTGPLTQAPVALEDGFLPLDIANAMRADIDAHFADPMKHNAEQHQVWNYWYVPGLYTYLRTFYRDEKRPTGWNNLAFPNVGMPHALWELQGSQVLKIESEEHQSLRLSFGQGGL